MMVKPSVTELLTKADNRYELVIATSRRARQIVKKRLDEKNAKKNLTGNETSTSTNTNVNVSISKIKEESPVTIAATEIADGKVIIIEENEGEQK